MLLAVAAVAASLTLVPASSAAQTPPTATLGLNKSASVYAVEPGDVFSYTIEFECTTGQVTGCVNAAITDPLPSYVLLNGPITISPTVAHTITSEDPITIVFQEDLGAGEIGLISGEIRTITIPVRLDPQIPPSMDGVEIPNTATFVADNAELTQSTEPVRPSVDQVLAATTTKQYSPTGGLAEPGTATTLTINSTSTSNIAVTEMVVVDPTDDPIPASPNPFQYLEVTGQPTVTLPADATTVQIDVWNGTVWVDGTAGATAAWPDGVDLDDIAGVRYTFAGGDIRPGAAAQIQIPLAQRDNVTSLGAATTVDNTANTTVTDADDNTATSPDATATYTITPLGLDVIAGKSFDPTIVTAGDTSTVTLTGENDSGVALDALTVTDNPLPATLDFVGIGNVTWPGGATAATITYWCNGNPQSPVALAASGSTPPAPPCSPSDVTGFAITFTGAIVDGGTATIPFTVATDPNQVPDELTHVNTVQVDGARGGATADDSSGADLLSIVERLAVAVDKQVSPDDILAIPGQLAVVQLEAQVLPFPTDPDNPVGSTTDAAEIIVQDPATIPSDWYDYFAPSEVAATPVPACAVLAVEYTTNGTTWLPATSPATFTGPTIANAVITAPGAVGIRFVYTPASGCDDFPPSTTVAPNIVYEVREDIPDPLPEDPLTVENCATSLASNGTIEAEASPAGCGEIVLHEPEDGEGAGIDKAWDRLLVNSRSQAEVGATISWSTGGYTGIDTVTLTDFSPPLPITGSVFDAWDLVRIDPITSAMDPLLTYDRILAVELTSNGTTWVAATNNPCPGACDGTFPGVTLTAAEVASTIAFRLVYEESPTRGNRTTGFPPVGSGVASSMGTNRQVHPVFRLRDTFRSAPNVPVIEDHLFNVAGVPGDIDNTVRITTTGALAGSWTASDIISLTDIPVTVGATKTWSGGPLGIPDPTVPAADYPTSRVTLAATNTTPAKIDRLVIVDDTNSGAGAPQDDPFEWFDVTSFNVITPPATIGATTAQVVLTYEGGATETFTREAALLLTAAALADVVHFEVRYDGRININATATVEFDVRLREFSRDDGTTRPTTAVSPVSNQVTVTGSDLIGLVDQGGAPLAPRTGSDAALASIALTNQGLGVTPTKAFSPTSQTEPDNSPVTVTLTAQPSGPSRTVQMVVSDTDESFWNQYDFVALNTMTLTSPINRVRVDALVGGTWSIDPVTGDPVLSGAVWEDGEFSATAALPAGVTAAQVQGLRFVFNRADGANWENPATPTQTIRFQVQRRAELNTGGPVPSDLGPLAPGETVEGQATNTITAQVTSSDVGPDGRPLTASNSTTATIQYVHGRNSVAVVKAPNGNTIAPGTPFLYTLRVTNDGVVDITNPVITDVLPADGAGPQVLLADDPTFTYLQSGGTGMPTDPDEVTVTATDEALVFTFPAGSTLEVGATYTITFPMVLRPGLAAGTQFTNTFGVVGDRPWDACGGTLDPDTGSCDATATNTVQAAGAVAIRKLVRAEGSDVLGVTRDPVAPQITCTQLDDGFYARPCVPIARPGGDVTWRFRVVNTGNLPIDRILAIDSLPAVGDTLATAPILARGSEWRPLLVGTRPTLNDPAFGTMNVWYTTGASTCGGPSASDGTLLCPANPWQEWPEGTALPVDPEQVTGLQFELLPAVPLGAGESTNVDLAMIAPAYDPDADVTADQMDPEAQAYNTVGTAARYQRPSGQPPAYTLVTEPPRVGVALANGPLQVVKVVEGDAARHAPTSFAVELACVSVGIEVPLPGSIAAMTLEAGVPVTVNNLPWAAECTVTEVGDHGQTSSTSTTAIVDQADQDLQVTALTNVYEAAPLAITKLVDTTAVDNTGRPVDYGPFTVTVECTHLGRPVFADGFDLLTPMVFSIAAGETVTLGGLPVRSSCTITETDDKGAAGTSIVVEPMGTDGDDTVTVELPVGDLAATVTNTYTVGSVLVTKALSGPGASTASGPFTVVMRCVLTDASGTRTVWDGDIVLGGSGPLEQQIDHLPTGASCTFEETAAGGASSNTVDPAAGVVVGDGTVVTVTVTNYFTATSAGGGSLASTGSSATGILASACAVVLAGVIALLTARQRRVAA